MAIEVLTTADAERWRVALPASVCVMGSLEYVRVLERQTGCAARLLVAGGDAPAVAYPFLLRPIQSLPFAAAAPRARFDTFTAEYTGPVAVSPGPLAPEVSAELAGAVSRYYHDQGVVAEFAHLNPWTAATAVLERGAICSDREIVYVDLTWGEERIWKHSLSSDTRRQTRQSMKAGVQVRHARSSEDVREFHRLYHLTMERRRALGRYLLPLDYFLGIFETMRDASVFALAEHGGRVVAGGLFLHGGTDVYWHLSAFDLEYAHVRPVNAMVYDTILWALRAGKRRILCGGGYAAGDGVFRFKAGFSPLRLAFSTYRRVHDRASYDRLMEAWSAHHRVASGDGFFPAYRCQPSTAAADPRRDDEGTRPPPR